MQIAVKRSKTLKKGIIIKVPFGLQTPQAYKRGLFAGFQESKGEMKYGYFLHSKSGKILRRSVDEFIIVSDEAERSRVIKELDRLPIHWEEVFDETHHDDDCHCEDCENAERAEMEKWRDLQNERSAGLSHNI